MRGEPHATPGGLEDGHHLPHTVVRDEMSTMHSLWPMATADPAAELSDTDLEELYDYPTGLTRPWVQANFVSSADGAVSLAERSEGLSHPADKRIFTLGRDLADVVLVGAGTVEAEDYKGVKATERRMARRQRLERQGVPPIAVVSGRCTLAPDAALFSRTTVPPIVITTEAAPAERKNALVAAGAELLVAGAERVELATALAGLAARGMYRVNCEGGPHLLGSLLAEDLCDQLCLTVAPLLAGPDAGRIVAGDTPAVPRHLRLASLLHEDGFCMFRYTRDDRRPAEQDDD